MRNHPGTVSRWPRALALTIAVGLIAIGSAGAFHALAAGLYLFRKRFPSPFVAIPFLVDGLFWGYLTTRQRGASLFGGLALLSFGAALIFLHPSVRRRESA